MNTDNTQRTRLTANAHEQQKTANTCPNERLYHLPAYPVSRKFALAHGLQMQVSQAFIRWMIEVWNINPYAPVFLTKKAAESCQIPMGQDQPCEKGNLWEIFLVLDSAWPIPLGDDPRNTVRTPFTFNFSNGLRVPLHIVWDTLDADDPKGAITFMLPEEY